MMVKNSIKFGTLISRVSFFYKLIRSKFTNKPTPLVVTFSLTPQCNFDCAYCYGDYKNRRGQKLLTTEEIIGAIEELSRLGMAFLQLSGGEPLIRDDIDIIVNKANELGITLGMSTNGSLVEKKIETVKKIKTIAISFDGDEESNDANRGKGTYKLIMNAIKVAKKAGVNVHTYTTVTKNNLGSIDFIMEFAKRFKIYTEFGFPIVRTLKNDSGYRGLDLSIEEFREAVNKLLAYKKKNYPILFSQKVIETVLKWPDYAQKTYVSDSPPAFPHIKCFMGRNMIFIDCDGKVYPCIQMIGEFAALDFREVGIKKAVAHSSRHNCQACYLMCVNDFNLFFSLDPSVILNNLNITVDEVLRP